MAGVSAQRRLEIIDALRRGTVPRAGLDAFAVGLDGFTAAFDDDLSRVRSGASVFKAIRGEYGSGKTFVSRWLEERAKRLGFAASEVQISETETPLYRFETVYRRLIERLSTADAADGAFRGVIERWFFVLEQDVLSEGGVDERDALALLQRTSALMERRLADLTAGAPAFAAVLRAYREALGHGDAATAESLLAWVGGQPHVAASAKRVAGIKGELDHKSAMGFLQALLTVLRDAGFGGLLLVIDEVETLQRMRGDVREKSLNGLRQLIDELDAGRFPGLYLVITGTPAFFDGPQGVQRLPPLAQRLHVDFTTDARFDNPRAVQVRLSNFDRDRLEEVGRRIRDIYAQHTPSAGRVRALVDGAYVTLLAEKVTGKLGGKVGIAPRVFLKKLVADVLDRVDQFPEFDPRRDYSLTVSDAELTAIERAAASATSVDDIELEP
jgi:P-loop Domain of unknown function (DUF2791)